MIFHISHNDLDGVGCGILVKAAFPSVKTVYIGYDELNSVLDNIPPEAESIIVTDLSPSESWAERMAGERELLIIDHHITSEPLKKYPFTYHSIAKCATLLTWDKLTEDGAVLSDYKDFADCINDYDLWLMRRTDSLRMNTLFTLMGLKRVEKRFLSQPYAGFTQEEELIITLEEERRNAYIDRAFKNTSYITDKKGRRVAVVFAEQYSSELGNHILTVSDAEYVVLIDAQRKKVSLRSIREVDISPIAQTLGGGGHKNAAGFQFRQVEDLAEMLSTWDII